MRGVSPVLREGVGNLPPAAARRLYPTLRMSAIQYGADDVRKLRVPADAQSGHHRPGAARPPAGGIGYADELCG